MKSKRVSPSFRSSAFTFIEMMVVVAVIGLLCALAIPSFVKARDSSRLNIIYRNLRVIEEAKEQWAIEEGKTQGAPIADINELSDYLRKGKVRAVVSETYEPNAVGTVADAQLPPGVHVGSYPPGGMILAP